MVIHRMRQVVLCCSLVLLSTLPEGLAAAAAMVLERETNVVAGTGPFAVAGTPSAHHVAWVDADPDGHVLRLTTFLGGQEPLTRQVATDVDPLAPVFLDARGNAPILLYRAASEWYVHRVTRGIEPADAGHRISLLQGARPLAMSSDGRRAHLVVGLAAD